MAAPEGVPARARLRDGSLRREERESAASTRAEHGALHTRSVDRRFAVLVAAASRHLPSNARILDVGPEARPPSRGSLPADARFLNADLDAGDVHVSAEYLPIRDGSMDAVLSFAVLEHLPDPDAAIAECARVLRGGALLLVTHGVYPYHPCPDDYTRWTQAGLRHLVGRHLEVDVVEPIGGVVHLACALVGCYTEQAAARRRAARPLRMLTRALDAAGDRWDHLVPTTRDGRERFGAMSFAYFVRARRL